MVTTGNSYLAGDKNKSEASQHFVPLKTNRIFNREEVLRRNFHYFNDLNNF